MDVPDDRRKQVEEYYLQDDIVSEMVRVAQYREFAPTYPQGYGSRPDSISFPGDFRSFVEKGAIAFHGSVERWQNPLLIGQTDQDTLRTGWDLIIDIDADHGMEFAKTTALEIISQFRDVFNIETDNISVKFSGNRGFHLGIPQEAFPDKIGGKDLPQWYPRLPQAIVGYLRDRMEASLVEAFKEINPNFGPVIDERGPYTIADVENDWGQRHLFRMPYSVNEKSWLVSKPIEISDIDGFEKPDASIDNITIDTTFLHDPIEDDQGVEDLAVEALDWHARQQTAETDDEKRTKTEDYDIPDEALAKEHFPAPIKRILQGLEDGRKRALYILATFMRHVGYSWDDIEKEVWDWNERNKEELDDNYIKTQLQWHRAQNDPRMPPNFGAKGWYHDIGVLDEDEDEQMLENFSNPVPYASVLKAKAGNREDDETDGGKERKDTDT
jgi:hypothetical protein